ncbi:hypothetical protein [Legionella adelaidensis]|nr:hypothetical protein [Legionella adelaidensis]
MSRAEKFSIKNQIHVELINKCSLQVEQRLLKLQSIDKKILIGFALGTGAFLLSWLLPLTTVAMIGFAYGAYQLGLRQNAFSEYSLALENLANCCVWSLGDVATGGGTELLNHTTIKNMIKTLGPLTNPNGQDLKDFIDDDIETQIIEDVQKIRSEMEVEGYRLTPEQQNIVYNAYGYKKGGPLNILMAVVFAIKNSFFNQSQTNDAQAQLASRL